MYKLISQIDIYFNVLFMLLRQDIVPTLLPEVLGAEYLIYFLPRLNCPIDGLPLGRLKMKKNQRTVVMPHIT